MGKPGCAYSEPSSCRGPFFLFNANHQRPVYPQGLRLFHKRPQHISMSNQSVSVQYHPFAWEFMAMLG